MYKDLRKISKWGEAIAVRFNSTALAMIGINVGDSVEVEYHKDKIVIKKVK